MLHALQEDSSETGCHEDTVPSHRDQWGSHCSRDGGSPHRTGANPRRPPHEGPKRISQFASQDAGLAALDSEQPPPGDPLTLKANRTSVLQPQPVHHSCRTAWPAERHSGTGTWPSQAVRPTHTLVAQATLLRASHSAWPVGGSVLGGIEAASEISP